MTSIWNFYPRVNSDFQILQFICICHKSKDDGILPINLLIIKYLRGVRIYGIFLLYWRYFSSTSERRRCMQSVYPRHIGEYGRRRNSKFKERSYWYSWWYVNELLKRMWLYHILNFLLKFPLINYRIFKASRAWWKCSSHNIWRRNQIPSLLFKQLCCH